MLSTTVTDVRVYLADLRHDFSGLLANDCMPLGVSYIKAVMDRDLPEAQSRLFAYPDRLLEALRSEPPDVLMLSNYMWNEWLSLHFAALAKQLNPEMLVIMGGPNISLDEDRQIGYMEAHPELDVYLLGEGDFLGVELVREFLTAGKSLRGFREREIPSSVYRRADGDLVRTEVWKRKKEIEEIPSPWLTGCLDEFFDGKLAPLLETNRGCPFQCSFCIQGVRWYAKVHNFSLDRLREEIEYIGKRIRAVSPNMKFLRIADSNYGMYERDIEISSFIGEAQRKYGWPTFIDATTGKNRPERVIESLEKVSGAMVIYQALQSLNEETLRNIRRSNISRDAYQKVMIHVRGRGLRSLSDLILGLPGETLESHLGGIDQLLDAGTDEMHLFQAMLLKGSDLERRESREKYKFDSRFRVLPKNYGIYAGQKVFDVDEIVVATDTLSFDDYLEARKYALTFSIFWNNSWFEDAARFAHQFGVTPSQWMRAMHDALPTETGAVAKIFEDFIEETENELFPSREACVAFYTEDGNWEKLLAGEIGDNLMYKHRVRAAFFMWPGVCRYAMDTTRQLLLERGAGGEIAGFETFWDDFHRFVELKHAHGTSPEEILASETGALRYDIPAWLEAGTPKDVERFRLPSSGHFLFELPADAVAEIEALLQTWTASLVGLTKGVTRIRTTSLLRTCRRIEPALAAAESAG
jgi:radical SAM superfamily enzyme YgiQ (UPF0313 family)